MNDDENNLLPSDIPDETQANDAEIEDKTDVPEQPGLVDILVAEIRALAAIGLELRQKIDSAKTAPKKKLYKKKLEKNSRRAAEIILYLEQVQVNKAIQKHKEEQQFIDIRNNEDGDRADTSDGTITRGRTSEESKEA